MDTLISTVNRVFYILPQADVDTTLQIK